MVSIALSKISAEDLKYQIAHYDENRSRIITIVTTIFFALSLILVALRLLTKVLKRLDYHVADYLIVVAMLFTTGLWVGALLCVKYGAGKHSLRVFREQGVDGISKGLQVLFAIQFSYHFAHLAIKVSILLFYKSVFTFVVVWFKWAWHFVLAYVAANFVVSIALVLTQCQPISHIWNEARGAAGECGNLSAIAIASGIITTVADFMLLVLPMPILWSLQRPMKERLMLCGLFALSSLTLVASIARIIYMAKVVSAVDFTFIELDTLIWSIIEVNLGVICACIPTVRPLFKRKPTEKRSTTTSYSGDSKSGAGFRSKQQTFTGNSKSTRSLDEYPLTKMEEGGS